MVRVVRQADEILILRRFGGYLRLHIPALIYSGKAAYLLERGLTALEGVRKIAIKKETGKLSVYYDEVMAPESEILLAVDKVATPLLSSDHAEIYKKTMAEVESAERRRLMEHAVVAGVLVYLLKIHWRLITRYWLRNPIRYWPEILAIASLIYLHRRQIRGVVAVE